MHSIKSGFVIGSSDILFGGVYVCTFQPGNFTGWGSEGVKEGFDRAPIGRVHRYGFFLLQAIERARDLIILEFKVMRLALQKLS